MDSAVDAQQDEPPPSTTASSNPNEALPTLTDDRIASQPPLSTGQPMEQQLNPPIAIQEPQSPSAQEPVVARNDETEAGDHEEPNTDSNGLPHLLTRPSIPITNVRPATAFPTLTYPTPNLSTRDGGASASSARPNPPIPTPVMRTPMMVAYAQQSGAFGGRSLFHIPGIYPPKSPPRKPEPHPPLPHSTLAVVAVKCDSCQGTFPDQQTLHEHVVYAHGEQQPVHPLGALRQMDDYTVFRAKKNERVRKSVFYNNLVVGDTVQIVAHPKVGLDFEFDKSSQLISSRLNLRLPKVRCVAQHDSDPISLGSWPRF